MRQNKYQNIMERLAVNFNYRASNGIPTFVTDAKLNEEEAQLGHALPADYREFLPDYGGYAVDALYPVWENGVLASRSAWMFYGSGLGEQSLANNHHLALKYFDVDASTVECYPGLNVVRSMEGVEELGWPPELLRISIDGGGNETCLALFGLRPGAIFHWRNAPGDGDNVYLVADSFDEFMHLLFKDE